ncbi:unnamed protein product, partial [Symbiodinium sp. CCMP2456]
VPSPKLPSAGSKDDAGRAKSPKWDFKKGDDPSKKTSQESARSASPKTEKPQATVESSSKAAKPRADEASTPPQSPRPIALRREGAGRDGANVEHALRDKSAKWSFKKGDDPSKMGSAKESTRHRMLQSRAKSPKLDFKKGDDPSKKTSQEFASASPKAEQPQATVESSSKADKPRADEASTPPQSPRPIALRREGA